MPRAAFVGFDHVREFFRGKSVAIVGSAPSVLSNAPGFVDSHDIVCRINNHRCSREAGRRTDVHYSFYGGSIHKSPQELHDEGVRLVLCKCPNSRPIDCEWHVRNNKLAGIDFRYIYNLRRDWWFCDTFVPDDATFLAKMAVLGGHIPTTGFAAILDVLACEPASVYLTGFDGFTSRVHNVDRPWKPGDPADPIGHVPERELDWIAARSTRFSYDAALDALIVKRLQTVTM